MKKYISFLMLTSFLVINACSSSKTSTGNATDKAITDIYWRLTEIYGKPIPAAGPDKKVMYIRLKKETGTIEGFGGCNGFGGQFTIGEGGKITISNVIGTMMACDRSKDENKLFEALQDTDNYIHLGKKLILNKGKKAPLARFEADYAK